MAFNVFLTNHSVETVLKMCGLENFADAIVGSLGVEHRKRTTIGVELAAKPKLLLFLDEPTSGLDSQSAWAIVTFLRSLADRGQAILCTYVPVVHCACFLCVNIWVLQDSSAFL